MMESLGTVVGGIVVSVVVGVVVCIVVSFIKQFFIRQEDVPPQVIYKKEVHHHYHQKRDSEDSAGDSVQRGTEKEEGREALRAEKHTESSLAFWIVAAVMIAVIVFFRSPDDFSAVMPEQFREIVTAHQLESTNGPPHIVINMSQDAAQFRIYINGQEDYSGLLSWNDVGELCTTIAEYTVCAVPAYDEARQMIRMVDPFGSGEEYLTLRPITKLLPDRQAE